MLYTPQNLGQPSPNPDTYSSLSYTYCSVERGYCSFSGTRVIRYGTKGIYIYKVATDGVSCTNDIFGDPLLGAKKACFYSDDAVGNTLRPAPAQQPSSVSVTGITINAGDITDGSKQQLTAKVSPANASNQTLTWSVNNDSIATITSTGALKPLENGQVTITAEATDGSGVYDTAAIEIRGVAYSGTVVSNNDELLSALESAKAGSTIYVRGGLYYFGDTITLGQNGSQSKTITLSKYPGDQKRPLFDFSAMSESGSNRGLKLEDDYWHIYGIDVKKAGDNCLYITGSNNVVEFSTLSECADTGVQLAKGASHNLIKKRRFLL